MMNDKHRLLIGQHEQFVRQVMGWTHLWEEASRLGISLNREQLEKFSHYRDLRSLSGMHAST